MSSKYNYNESYKFLYTGLNPIELVIQEQSDLCECKNWYLDNSECVVFMAEEFITPHKIVENFIFSKAHMLDRLEKLKAP